ncbi:hypothetical protein T10_3954 [Trichinella papuae]|uniref:Uncharacterized protein n=1 Tax=Trichinella papuae TaxID=268474 RepID=A0A0V1MI04_9BILA|nr:hypothetical protein T10_3954 [Trichinella papuae]
MSVFSHKQNISADVTPFKPASSRALQFFQIMETVDCDNPNCLQIEAFFLPSFNALTTATLSFTDNAISFDMNYEGSQLLLIPSLYPSFKSAIENVFDVYDIAKPTKDKASIAVDETSL